MLIVSALFVTLTAGLDRSLFTHVSLSIGLLTLGMIFVVRPLAIALATMRSGLSWQERVLLGWIAPRGIVAAAVAGVASAKLTNAGDPGGALILPAVFALIAATMILHGFSLAPLARRLGLTLGDRPSLAIIGATSWTTDLAATLHEAGTPVLMIDSFPGALNGARERRLPVLQAEILSAHAEEELADRRMDYLFAATTNDVYNSLVCAKLAPELGRGRVFQLVPNGGDTELWLSFDREWRGQALGAPPLEFAQARRRYKDGWRFVLRERLEDPVENPSDDASASSQKPGYPARDGDVQILCLRKNGELAFATLEAPELTVAVGDQLLVLAEPERPVEHQTRPIVEEVD